MTRRPLSCISTVLLLSFLPLATTEPRDTAEASLAPIPTASAVPSVRQPERVTPKPKATTVAPHRTPKLKRTATELAKKPKVSPSPRHTTAQSSTAPRTPSYTSPKAYARSVLSATEYSCADAVFTHESNWNAYATNPTSGAYGIAQALPPSKYASAGSDWRTNPITQVRWGLGYMDARYGSPCAAWSFWQSHNWY